MIFYIKLNNESIFFKSFVFRLRFFSKLVQNDSKDRLEMLVRFALVSTDMNQTCKIQNNKMDKSLVKYKY